MMNESKPYLVCQNPECSLAQKNKAWITDFGIGTVTDSVKCYGCKKHFRGRSASQDSRKSNRPPSGTVDTSEVIPKKKKGSGKGGNNSKGGGKGSNSSDPTTDVEYWKNMFEQAVSAAKDQGGIDAESLEALIAPPPPPIIVPGVSELNKLKKQIGHIERNRLAKHGRLVENIDEFKQIRSDLAEFDANIADLNEQFNQMVLDSKIVQVQTIHVETTDTSDHVSVPNDVSLWDAEMFQTFQTKLLEHQEYQHRVQLNLLDTAMDEDIGAAAGPTPQASPPTFGKAAKGSGRSTPYEKRKAEADIEIEDEEANEDFPEDMLSQHLEEATLLAGSTAAASSGAIPQLG